MLISLSAHEAGVSIRNSEILSKWRVSSHWLWLESSWVILWKTWLESSRHFS